MGLQQLWLKHRLISKSHFKSRGDSKLQLSVNARAMHKFSIKEHSSSQSEPSTFLILWSKGPYQKGTVKTQTVFYMYTFFSSVSYKTWNYLAPDARLTKYVGCIFAVASTARKATLCYFSPVKKLPIVNCFHRFFLFSKFEQRALNGKNCKQENRSAKHTSFPTLQIFPEKKQQNFF